ncbi:hypothetical protein HDC92_003735 [Pedobacter sp. AK017]|uniref:sigma-70 family RNA polymerase sigma factor n=1 Tax=Pedobacter sp. AK017 TaxID=2723073 RepID=UPI0016220FA6|nr:sigma-70 family RNA polymerase sigma factor [Pedobacter sp. AK017]MBB5440037.1 hypothetical protein [Pedobacter sp. AK017]
MLQINQNLSVKNGDERLKQVYDQYGGMLLGYINQVIDNEKIAEEFLVNIFTDIARNYNVWNWDEYNIWSQLLNFARSKLIGFSEMAMAIGLDPQKNSASNKCFTKLSTEQRHVLKEVYYKGRLIQTLAKNENKPEDLIRKTLKEAFDQIRNTCGH